MKFILGIFLVVCLWMVLPTIGAISNEEKYYDREVIHQVANWLVQAVRNNEANLCNPASPHKRNSEIINSILGLPKNLNDVGRK